MNYTRSVSEICEVTTRLATSVNYSYRESLFRDQQHLLPKTSKYGHMRIGFQRNFGCLMYSLRIWWTAICGRNPGSPLEKLFAGVILVHDDLYKA